MENAIGYTELSTLNWRKMLIQKKIMGSDLKSERITGIYCILYMNNCAKERNLIPDILFQIVMRNTFQNYNFLAYLKNIHKNFIKKVEKQNIRD